MLLAGRDCCGAGGAYHQGGRSFREMRKPAGQRKPRITERPGSTRHSAAEAMRALPRKGRGLNSGSTLAGPRPRNMKITQPNVHSQKEACHPDRPAVCPGSATSLGLHCLMNAKTSSGPSSLNQSLEGVTRKQRPDGVEQRAGHAAELHAGRQHHRHQPCRKSSPAVTSTAHLCCGAPLTCPARAAPPAPRWEAELGKHQLPGPRQGPAWRRPRQLGNSFSYTFD